MLFTCQLLLVLLPQVFCSVVAADDSSPPIRKRTQQVHSSSDRTARLRGGPSRDADNFDPYIGVERELAADELAMSTPTGQSMSISMSMTYTSVPPTHAQGSMSMSLLNCKRAEEPYDTGSGTITFDVNELVTPEAGETFTFFDYSSASANYTCSAGEETGIMTFFADGSFNADGTIAECLYEACYDEECKPDCCCDNSIIFKVDD